MHTSQVSCPRRESHVFTSNLTPASLNLTPTLLRMYNISYLNGVMVLKQENITQKSQNWLETKVYSNDMISNYRIMGFIFELFEEEVFYENLTLRII